MATLVHAVKVMASTKEALSTIKEYGDQIVGVAKTVEANSRALSGDRLIQSAHNWTAAVERMGEGTKLTNAEMDKVHGILQKAIDKYTALGQVAPAAMTKLYDETKRAVPEIETVTTKTSMMQDVMAKLGPMVVAAFSFGAVRAFIGSILEGADTLAKLSLKASMSAEELQRLDVVAIGSGSSLEGLVGASQNLQDRLGSGDAGLTKALATLNVSLSDLGQMGAYEQLTTIGDAVGSVRDPTERAALAADTFGKSWKEILPALVTGMGDVSSAAFVMSNDTVARLDEMGDRWDELVRTMKAGAGELIGIFPAVSNNFGAFLQGLVREGSIQGGLAGAAIADSLRRAAADGLAKPLPTVAFREITTASGLKVWALETSKAFDAVAASFGSAGRAGKPLTLSAAAVEDAIKQLDAAAKKTADQTLAEWKRKTEEADRVTRTWNEGIQRSSEKMFWLQAGIKNLAPVIQAQFTREIKDARAELGLLDATAIEFGLVTLPAVVKSSGVVGASIGRTLGSDIETNLASALKRVPQIIMDGFTGGGGFWGSLKAIGVSIADAVAQPMIDRLALKLSGALKGVGAAGGAAGGLMAAFFIIYAQGIANMLSDSKRINAYFDELAAQRKKREAEWAASVAAIKTSYADLLTQLAAYGTTLGVVETRGVVQVKQIPILENILKLHEEIVTKQGEIKALQESLIPTWDDVKSAAGRYGIALDTLGPKVSQLGMNETAKGLVEDWDMFTRAGANMGPVLDGMKTKINALVKDSFKFGTTVPDNMRPMIEALFKAGKLTGEDGKALTDLTLIKFGPPVVTEADKIIKAIGGLVTDLEKLFKMLAEQLAKATQIGVEATIRELDRIPREIVIKTRIEGPGKDGKIGDDGTDKGDGTDRGRDFGRNFGFPIGRTFGEYLTFHAPVSSRSGERLSGSVSSGRGGNQTIHVQLNADGRKLADVVIDNLGGRLSVRGAR